jgi:hypothetical protein
MKAHLPLMPGQNGKIPKAMIGHRLSQEEAKNLLAKSSKHQERWAALKSATIRSSNVRYAIRATCFRRLPLGSCDSEVISTHRNKC